MLCRAWSICLAHYVMKLIKIWLQSHTYVDFAKPYLCFWEKGVINYSNIEAIFFLWLDSRNKERTKGNGVRYVVLRLIMISVLCLLGFFSFGQVKPTLSSLISIRHISMAHASGDVNIRCISITKLPFSWNSVLFMKLSLGLPNWLSIFYDCWWVI